MNTRLFLARLADCSEFLGLLRQFSFIEGWLHEAEAIALYLLAAEGPALGEIVEIGSYLGKSTAFLAAGTKKAGREKVTAVDHFQGSPEHQQGMPVESKVLITEGTTFRKFMDNIQKAQVADQIEPVNASSATAIREWKKPIRLLFIDADHSYESSRQDFLFWSPFLVKHGMIGFHDIGNFEGVTRFYNELMQSTKEYREIAAVRTLRIIQKM